VPQSVFPGPYFHQCTRAPDARWRLLAGRAAGLGLLGHGRPTPAAAGLFRATAAGQLGRQLPL